MAKTPYQQLLGSGVLTRAKQGRLAAIFHGLNPVLLFSLNVHLEHLWRLAEHPTPRAKAQHQTHSVTGVREATNAVRQQFH